MPRAYHTKKLHMAVADFDKGGTQEGKPFTAIIVAFAAECGLRPVIAYLVKLEQQGVIKQVHSDCCVERYIFINAKPQSIGGESL